MWVPMHQKKDLIRWMLGLFLGSVVFLSLFIQFPRTPNFDEFHYIPSAKQFLELKTNQNWEHPPLAKELIAIGIGVLGDRPAGWRFMSVLFGSVTLVGMFAWAWVLWRRKDLAIWVALVTLGNHLLYVQSRIAMLDTFMFGFLVWAMVAFTAAWSPTRALQSQKRLLLASGVLFGLATACKWSAMIPWLLVIGLVLVLKVLQHWGVHFQKEKVTDWFHPKLFAGIRLRHWILYLGVVPLLAYYATFLPYAFIPGTNFSFLGVVWGMQKTMYEGQLRVVNDHPYMSKWWQWPLLLRPIWYAFDKEGPKGEWVRGVILLGNPWVMWTGLLALAAGVWGWLYGRRKDAFWVTVWFASLYLGWIVIPRKVAFYYYYYPAGMVLTLALAYVFIRAEELSKTWGPRLLWVYAGITWAVFAWFYPVLSGIRIPTSAFSEWMWLSSWI